MSFDEDLASLADVVKRARPGWGVGPIRDRLRALGSLPGMTAGRTLDAALRAAGDPAAVTPDAITWDRYRAEPARDSGGPRCLEHPTLPAYRCPSCLADVAAGDRPASQVGKRLLTASGESPRPITAEERARLREGLSRLAQGMRSDCEEPA
jgi:hypothetical protein